MILIVQTQECGPFRRHDALLRIQRLDAINLVQMDVIECIITSIRYFSGGADSLKRKTIEFVFLL